MRRTTLLMLWSCVGLLGSSSVWSNDARQITTAQELQNDLQQGRSPLFDLSEFGRAELLASLRWGDRGLGGFSVRPLLRELTAEQLNRVLFYLKAENYQSYFAPQITDGAPLRLSMPDRSLVDTVNDLRGRYQQQRMKQQQAETLGITRSDDGWFGAIHTQLESKFLADALKQTRDGNLLLLFDIALEASEWTGETVFVDWAQKAVAELQRRGIDTRREVNRSLYTQLLALRQFETAREFLAHNPIPNTQTVPELVDTLGPVTSGLTVYDYDAQNHRLQRQALTPAKVQLILTVGSGCHFSQDALNAIAQDLKLQQRLLDANFSIVTTVRDSLSLSYLTDWNRDHPTLPIRVPFSRQEWRALDRPEVPSFFLLIDGQVENVLSGWPSQGQRQQLLALLDKYQTK